MEGAPLGVSLKDSVTDAWIGSSSPVPCHAADAPNGELVFISTLLSGQIQTGFEFQRQLISNSFHCSVI